MNFYIGNKKIGDGCPTYFIAELSCNHMGSLDKALELVKLAAESGADCFKTQTYTGDTITLKCNKPDFNLKGTKWDNKGTLWDLFNAAHTPWEWNKRIKEECDKFNLEFLSSPFDETAVDFLEQLGVKAYKIASMEIVDIPLLKKVGLTKKPVIMSTGMASQNEIKEAITVLKSNGCPNIALLKCTSAYPAKPEQANLLTIPDLKSKFNVIPGLSDHTLTNNIPIAACALGSKIVEKHFIKSRTENSYDSKFSIEPDEFKYMVDSIKIVEKSLGEIKYGGVKGEVRQFRKSLYITKDLKKGDILQKNINIKSIRPGMGLHSRYMDDFIGKKVIKDVEKGSRVSWNLIK